LEFGAEIVSGGTIFAFQLVICRLFGAGFFIASIEHHLGGVN
jgi:hypothetical protein